MKRLLLVLIFSLLVTLPSNAAPPALDDYNPLEWYGIPSVFFRDVLGNVIAVMATDSHRLPVDIGGGISVTIGSSTFVAAPVFSDAVGSETLGLLDSERRMVMNLGSDTIGLITNLAAIQTEITACSATNTAELQTLQAINASITAQIVLHMAQQASESLDIRAAQASSTSDLLAALASNTLAIESSPTVVPSVGTATDTPLFTQEYPPSSYTTEVLSVGPVDVVVTNMANRATISGIASGPFMVGIGTTTVPVGTAEVYNFSFPAGPEVPVSLQTTATYTNITIYQARK